MSNLATCRPYVNDCLVIHDIPMLVMLGVGQSWLDHCISTEDVNDIITNAHVVY